MREMFNKHAFFYDIPTSMQHSSSYRWYLQAQLFFQQPDLSRSRTLITLIQKRGYIGPGVFSLFKLFLISF